MNYQIALAMVVALAGFGATTAQSADISQEEPTRCMLTRAVRDFHVIDRHHVVLMDRREETFLLGTMRPGCWDIHHAPAIALVSPALSVCAGSTATLRVWDESCHIVRLEAVANVEAAVSLVDQRSEAVDSGD